MDFITYTAKDYTGFTNLERDYTITKINYSDFKDFEKQEIINEANTLYFGTNSKGANTGIRRSNMTKWNDCVSGILAEFAVNKFLNIFLKDSVAHRPKIKSIENQVDIELNCKNKTYTIEVRSSFVNNGIPFALYSINSSSNNLEYKNNTYFDVLGPYRQKSYKINFEEVKDLFFRVLFNGRKYDVENRFINNNEDLYIIGGMWGNDIVDLNYKKTLTAKDAVNILPGDYYVAPINNILDTNNLLNYFK